MAPVASTPNFTGTLGKLFEPQALLGEVDDMFSTSRYSTVRVQAGQSLTGPALDVEIGKPERFGVLQGFQDFCLGDRAVNL